MKRSDYLLSPIYSSKNLAKKVLQNQKQANKANLVGPDKDTAILGKITIKMDASGKLYQRILGEVNKLQNDLFGGISFEDKEWFSFKMPDPLVDLVNSGHPGYCFGDEE